MTEAEIIKGCIRQDRHTQKALYETFYSRMMGICLRYAKNGDEAKDILQEGFIKVFQHIRSFQGSGSLEGWIKRIMVNTAIDHLRKNKHEYLIVSTVNANRIVEAEKEDENTDEDILNIVSKEDILKAVQELTPAYRTVFNLYIIDEFTHREIADKLGISEGTSKSNLAKAKYNLRKVLNQLTNIKSAKRA